MLILASQSIARRAMLEAAGVAFTAEGAGVDEDAAKQAMLAQGLSGRDIADALAELKAVKVSQRHPGALVLGSDSTVVTADNIVLDKPGTREEAERQLRGLAGTTHHLHSGAVVAQNGMPIWRHVDTATLTMRPFSDAFLQSYLDQEWPEISGCVGGCRLEGLGVQLFSRIDGSHFTILGLPLLALLDWLRVRGELLA
ncbi:nucleoside triphosphate pyrophosphatase [uncultured Sphingomonas sp.]|uniref:Maf family protein n=1 Tax=uncultured Sphingomonas sp. TaxID=158754 RepID=UPI0025FFE9BB|nr:nucleoside triphosphate pyrophosphatase [uncultured Sphingomonas sp.]